MVHWYTRERSNLR
ncbi:unnamed protein product, partial [Didymodactylos carnosus]